jgi:hypothetical protein
MSRLSDAHTAANAELLQLKDTEVMLDGDLRDKSNAETIDVHTNTLKKKSAELGTLLSNLCTHIQGHVHTLALPCALSRTHSLKTVFFSYHFFFALVFCNGFPDRLVSCPFYIPSASFRVAGMFSETVNHQPSGGVDPQAWFSNSNANVEQALKEVAAAAALGARIHTTLDNCVSNTTLPSFSHRCLADLTVPATPKP